MSTPEAKVKNWLRYRLEVDLPGAWTYWPPGGTFGKAGMMDCLGLYEGVPFAIETKDDGRDPTPLQWSRIRAFGNAKGIACVMRGKDRDRLNLLTALIKQRAARIAPMIRLEDEPMADSGLSDCICDDNSNLGEGLEEDQGETDRSSYS